eukprot:CAMPEP_0197626912 /NCGR_PEP_ID=MMETSP1338-20131121/5681_1 /TAXON_ID=43686 ORGANISM="Pelagodinium beii, Strain RCC1491" /NCGR_SAMPLE_ID=MMETSP1338 /ASSEMBLY_ACC=CAM_ASM_000754 /LENGTH=456 /DNA_ID=CAMNT_0043197507 /DNA_START=52 /DNA_END=1422 /DNA_ORIENTATION=+
MGCGCSSAKAVQVAPVSESSGVVPTPDESPAAQSRVLESANSREALELNTQSGAKTYYTVHSPPSIASGLGESTTAGAKAKAAPSPKASAKAQASPAAAASETAPAPKAKATARRKSLIKAVKDGDVAAVDDILKEEGCNLEALGMWDNTPLLAACTYGHTEAALRLIEHGANVLARNEHQATPLHYASVEGSLNVVSALIKAAAQGGSDVTKMVNAEPAKVYNRHLDAYGQRTPLQSAAESGFPEIIEVLLASGARLDEEDEDGRTALWLASRHSRISAAKTLLQHGARASAKDKEGVSILGAAVAGGCKEELVFALLANGITDVNDTSGSPLRDAVKSGQKSIVEALLTNGASVNATAVAGGATALHAACEKGDEHLVSLLVHSRADPSLGDASGLTAFDLLRRRGLPDGKIVSLLKPPEADGGQDDGGTGSAAGGMVAQQDSAEGAAAVASVS